LPVRGLFGALAVVLIVAPFGTVGKFAALTAFAILLALSWRARPLATPKPVT
jgi:hypothetical protein